MARFTIVVLVVCSFMRPCLIKAANHALSPIYQTNSNTSNKSGPDIRCHKTRASNDTILEVSSDWQLVLRRMGFGLQQCRVWRGGGCHHI